MTTVSSQSQQDAHDSKFHFRDQDSYRISFVDTKYLTNASDHESQQLSQMHVFPCPLSLALGFHAVLEELLASIESPYHPERMGTDIGTGS